MPAPFVERVCALQENATSGIPLFVAYTFGE